MSKPIPCANMDTEMVKVKRIYDPVESDDGERVLVDRLWPRGVSKEGAQLAEWAKDLAPSDALRTWFHANLSKWAEFRTRYQAELDGKGEELQALGTRARSGCVTLLYASRERERNHAIILRDLLQQTEDDGL